MFSTAFGLSTMREQARMIMVSVLAPILGFYTPVKNFVLVVVIMFAFNIFAGMRADKVSILRCRNFSMKKFRHALAELIMYLMVMILVFTVMTLANDQEASLIVVKSLSYVFVYVYMQNALRNMIISYPKVVVLHVLYHVIRLEFKRALPEHIREVVERCEKEGKEMEGNVGALVGGEEKEGEVWGGDTGNEEGADAQGLIKEGKGADAPGLEGKEPEADASGTGVGREEPEADASGAGVGKGKPEADASGAGVGKRVRRGSRRKKGEGVGENGETGK